MDDVAYKRVLIKLSGEALMGEGSLGVDPRVVEHLAHEVNEAYKLGTQIGIVVGGGNIFRGMAASARGMERAQADYMGMLATVMNGLALQDAFEKAGMETRVMSAIEMNEVCERYIRRKAIRHLEKGRVTIFVAGTGNPYFTTDSAAALRACEIEADCLMKATNVDGVYTQDPKTHKDAQRYDKVSYQKVLVDNLHVMDAAAIALCRDNSMPLFVFDIHQPGAIKQAIMKEHVGTYVSEKE